MSKKKSNVKVIKEKTEAIRPKPLTAEEMKNMEVLQQPKTLEQQIQELKAPYYISKGNLDSVVDGMLAKLLGQSLTQQRLIEEFKKNTPKEKWPKALQSLN